MCFLVAETPAPPTGRSAFEHAWTTERPVRCGGCGRAYEHSGWLDLPLIGTLTGDAIAAHVVKWPHGVRIEVRRCARCARSIARTGPTRGEPELPSSSPSGKSHFEDAH